MNKEIKSPATQQGEVVSVFNGTARVKIARRKVHPIYNKRYTAHTTLLAAVPAGKEIEINQQVTIKHTRPLSKRKSWVIV